ncbi:hypothetical protein F443_03505 [Phytophthora nicotianae P1569]|uniref:RxLR effector protein n=1 Tax=Phytophthora nicotianae P1569 TaxID=1317065 RepID=V9FQ60_PHYNI|nr:hypothetical protein F443_03505 [Phytophthora nicotianae P1569]
MRLRYMCILGSAPCGQRLWEIQTTRFRRAHGATTETKGDKDLDEVRTINLRQILGLEENIFASKIISKMRDDRAFKLEMFGKWQQEGLSVGEIAQKLKVSRSKVNLKLLLEYINHANPPRVSEVTKVTFGGKDVRYYDTDEMLEWLKHFGR